MSRERERLNNLWSPGRRKVLANMDKHSVVVAEKVGWRREKVCTRYKHTHEKVKYEHLECSHDIHDTNFFLHYLVAHFPSCEYIIRTTGRKVWAFSKSTNYVVASVEVLKSIFIISPLNHETREIFFSKAFTHSLWFRWRVMITKKNHGMEAVLTWRRIRTRRNVSPAIWIS